MNRNVGGLDRTARLAGGAVLALVGVVVLANVVELSPIAGAAALLIGVVFLGTGAIQYCPINQALGIDTCPRR
jgi:predicted membrane channel-forming protein YqfA (hemolysin III family)